MCSTHFIPKRIFQTWKNDCVPEKHAPWVAKWKSLNPDYEYTLFTDEMNEHFMQHEYPQYYYLWKGLPRMINRIDFIRALYVHRYGGFYADLDMEPLKPLDDLLRIIPIQTKIITGRLFGWDGYLECAFLGSAPGHPFWLNLIEEIRKQQEEPGIMRCLMKVSQISDVISLTGPLRFGLSYYKYRNKYPKSDFFIAPHEWFFPWNATPKPCSYTVHHVVGTWIGNDHWNKPILLQFLIIFACILIVIYWVYRWGYRRGVATIIKKTTKEKTN